MNEARNQSRAVTFEDFIKKYNLNDLSGLKSSVKILTNELEKQSTLIKRYVKLMNVYKNQDKQMSWFYNSIPSIETEPFISFEDPQNDIGDLYYCRSNGKVYQLTYNFNTYSWEEIADNDLSQSMALAASKADTQDNKRVTWFETPSPIYNTGDIWVNNGIIMRCQVTRTEGVFNVNDWISQENYSEESVFLDVTAVVDQFKEEVKNDYTSKALLNTTVDTINVNVESVRTETTNYIDERYDEITGELVDYVKTSEFQELTNRVEQTISDTYTKTQVQQIITTGYNDPASGTMVQVTKVKSESGTFSDEGLRIQTEGENGEIISKTSGLFNEVGVNIQKVEDGVVLANQKPILFAGFVDENNQFFGEKYNGQTITATQNVIVDKYLVIGEKSRIEEYTQDGVTKTGVFPI